MAAVRGGKRALGVCDHILSVTMDNLLFGVIKNVVICTRHEYNDVIFLNIKNCYLNKFLLNRIDQILCLEPSAITNYVARPILNEQVYL